MSGGSNKAAKQAQKNSDEQQANIAQSTAQINSIFDNPSRTAQYGQLAKDTTSYYTQQLDDQKAINDRQLKFSLARNGQTGSSVQADQSAQSAKDYLSGVLEATRKGNAASAGLQAQDETSRANLIAQAQGGLDATSAATEASEAMKGNLATANSGNTADALGNMFGDFSTIYQKSQDAAALRQGYNYGLGNLYQAGFGYGTGKP